MSLLKQKHALVTGGASGIGEAIVPRFAAEGAHVTILDLNARPPVDLATTLQQAASTLARPTR